jgi:hypothetical protein
MPYRLVWSSWRSWTAETAAVAGRSEGPALEELDGRDGGSPRKIGQRRGDRRAAAEPLFPRLLARAQHRLLAEGRINYVISGSGKVRMNSRQ